jgi:RNA polymerase sigma-70 factor, ECF subfamily
MGQGGTGGAGARQSDPRRPSTPKSSRSLAAVVPQGLAISVVDINDPHRCTKMSTDETVAAAYRDHAAAIRGKALQLTRDPELAADITQEAFLRLFLEVQAGRAPDNIAAWLYRTSANLIVSRARRTAVAHRFAPRLLRDDEPVQPEAIAVLRETREEVNRVLSSLSTTDRAALILAAHGATGLEIADRLGRSHVAARTLLSRARGRLRTAAAGATPFAA